MKLFIFAVAWTCATFAVTLAYADNYVRDGDTIVIDDVPIRLKGLSCAEKGTELGDAQTAYLKQWMSTARTVDCKLTGETTYDRQVGWCEVDGIDLGAAMITNAYCNPCRRYDTTGKYDHLPVVGNIPKYCKEK